MHLDFLALGTEPAPQYGRWRSKVNAMNNRIKGPPVNASRIIFFIALLAVADTRLNASSGPDFTGRWEVTTSYPGGSYVAGLDLATDANRYIGRSGYLVP